MQSASGTAPTLGHTTNTLLAWGTTTPTVVLNAVGYWLLICQVTIDYARSTGLANEINAIFRRTNNTAATVGKQAKTDEAEC